MIGPAGSVAAPIRLPVRLGYASAELGINAAEVALRIFLLKAYTDVHGLATWLAGLALALGLLWDAVLDPVMGGISDRAAVRVGHRRNHVLLGGVLLATGTLMSFLPPALSAQWALFLWLLVSVCLLNSGMTVVAVPYLAMASEMTQDPAERTALFGYRFAAANLGAVLAVALPAALRPAGDSRTESAMGATSIVIAGCVVAGTVITFLATARIRFSSPTTHPERLGRSLLQALRNPTFGPLLAAYVVATAGIGINGASALYYYDYRLRLSDEQIPLLLAVFLLVFTLSLPLWLRAARRAGKLVPLVFGALALGVATSVMYPLLPPGQFAWPLVAGGIGLGSLVGCVVLLDSLLTDVVDHDSLHTGQGRGGLYFGIWRLAQKVARAVALGLTALVLDLSGFVPNQEQTELASWSLAMLFGPGVGVFFLAAGFLLWRYRFDAEKQAQVRALLQRRRERHR